VILEYFFVSGFRCLAATANIPLLRPTILTGANDGGKSTALAALAFLLGGPNPAQDDRTLARDEDLDVPGGLDNGRYAEIRVTGHFRLADDESKELDASPEVRLRRCFRNSRATYEYHTTVCSNPVLRDLDNKSLEDLKALAEHLGLTITGHIGRKTTFLIPIQERAAALPTARDGTGGGSLTCASIVAVSVSRG